MCVYLYCITHLPTRGYGQGVMKVSRILNDQSVNEARASRGTRAHARPRSRDLPVERLARLAEIEDIERQQQGAA